jgi:16S rRNA (adenine1518-N6/adenine1519-N6)-dimethyltransferase
MLDLAEVGAGDAVLEIGPGLGAITDVLATRAARLYVVEYDRGLCEVLRRKFADASHVHVIEGDALRVDLRAAIPETRVKVVASLPYNVSVPILFRLLEERELFPDVTVMVQHEVAARLLARAGSKIYGAPSLLFQLYAKPRGRFRVPASAFYPRPRVMSEVIRFELSSEPLVALENTRLFQAIVRAAFNQRRKMLRNALQTLSGAAALPVAVWDTVLASVGIDGRIRGEMLDLAAFAALSDAAGRTRLTIPRAERHGRHER